MVLMRVAGQRLPEIFFFFSRVSRSLQVNPIVLRVDAMFPL